MYILIVIDLVFQLIVPEINGACKHRHEWVITAMCLMALDKRN